LFVGSEDLWVAPFVGDQEHRVEELIDSVPQVVNEFALITFHT
jgi:hypothetical protein